MPTIKPLCCSSKIFLTSTYEDFANFLDISFKQSKKQFLERSEPRSHVSAERRSDIRYNRLFFLYRSDTGTTTLSSPYTSDQIIFAQPTLGLPKLSYEDLPKLFNQSVFNPAGSLTTQHISQFQPGFCGTLWFTPGVAMGSLCSGLLTSNKNANRMAPIIYVLSPEKSL